MGGAASLVAMLVSGLIGWSSSAMGTVFEGDTWSVIGWQVVSSVLLTWLAMGFTALTRSQAFALVVIFLWPLLIEYVVNIFFRLVPGLRGHPSARFLPFSAQRRMVDVLTDAGSTFGDPLSSGRRVVFGGVTAVLMAASYRFPPPRRLGARVTTAGFLELLPAGRP